MTHDATEELCQFIEMTEHDYESNNGFYAPPDCQCELIAKVRKETLDAAREAVKGVNWFNDEGKMLSAIVATAESLVAIDALREKQ